MEYYCCGLHHSSYCPECHGEYCESRIKYRLNPSGNNEEKINKINENMRGEENDKL